MRGAVCVGGLVLQTNQSVRLLQANGLNQPTNSPFGIGQVLDIDFTPAPNPQPPHLEDVLVSSAEFVEVVPDIKAVLNGKVPIWEGNPDSLFQGLVGCTGSGGGYIAERLGLPAMSTGYWRPDQPLNRIVDGTRFRYRYPRVAGIRSFPYVGLQDPIDLIPQGTLVRVSLARWWRPMNADDLEYRCYIQISGWYL